MKLDTDSLAHTKWNCKYHIVLALRKILCKKESKQIRK